jgi:hypothetical protein
MSPVSLLDTAWKRSQTGKHEVFWLLSIGLAVGLGHGLLINIDRLGYGDWDAFSSHSLVALRSWFEYGQAPFWSPWHCGGMAVTENFQSRVFSPSFLLVALFGPWWGNRLWMLLCLVLGFEGSRRLCMRLDAGPWGSLFAASAIAFNGAMFARMGIGHFGDVPYLLLPWWFLGLQTASRRLWLGALQGGFWGALCYLEGGIYAIIFASMIAAAWSVTAALRNKSFKPILALAAVEVSGLLLCMHILWPSVLNLVENVRTSVDSEAVPLSALGEIFISTDIKWGWEARFPYQRWHWFEYTAYAGPVFFLALLLALVRGRPHTLGWTALGLFFVLFAVGDFHEWSPWTLSHEFPVFQSMRASGRAFIPAIFCFAIAVAPALDQVRYVAPALTVALLLNLGWVGPTALKDAFTIHRRVDAPDPHFTQRKDKRHFVLIDRKNFSLMSVDVMRNRGALSCYDPLRPETHAKVVFPKQRETYLLGTRGNARFERWSPNSLTVSLTGLESPGILVINQNYHPGWRTADGRPLLPRYGVIATSVSPGDRQVRFDFHPPGFYPGLTVVALTLALLLYLARPIRNRRRPRRD